MFSLYTRTVRYSTVVLRASKLKYKKCSKLLNVATRN